MRFEESCGLQRLEDLGGFIKSSFSLALHDARKRANNEGIKKRQV